MKKWIAWAMAISVSFGSLGVTAYGSTFTDIGSVPWPGAATFIDQAASLGLMNGYNEDGKKYCKPRNNVSYCEAVQLMYSIMKAHSGQDVSDTTVTKWKPVMNAYNIPSWAYNAVAYGLENNIVATDELGKMRNGTGSANREEVGRIFGKALATLDGYQLQSNPTLGYRDAAQVSAEAKPYLELLNRAKLMVGDTDNNFNPRSNINRAEMAVLSVKTYNTLTENASNTPTTPTTGSVTATVVNSMVLGNGDLFLSLKTSAGAGLNLFGAKSSVTPTYDGKSIAFTDIGAGDTVTVAYSGDQIKTLIVTYSKEGIRQDVTYELTKITSARVTVTDGSKTLEYKLDSSAEIRLDGAKSTVAKISEALEDAKYNVTLTLDKDDYVMKLEAAKSENNPTKGLLTKLTDTKITIKSGSKSYDYTLDDDVTIKKDGKSVAFSKLKNDYEDNNYTVSVKLNSKGHVTDITIEAEEDETHGELTFLNSRRIEIKANNKTYKYDIEEDTVKVTIDGKSKSLDTLKESFNEDDKGYTVALEVSRDNVAKEIQATSKNADNAEGTIKSITSSEITITKDNKDYTHKLASDVTVKVDGSNSSVATLKDNYKDVSYEVELEFNTSGKVSKITATVGDVTEGILRDVRDDRSEIKVRVGGVNYDLAYTTNVSITLDGKSIDIDDLKDELDDAVGSDTIYVKLKYSGSRISKITATWEDENATEEGTVVRIDLDDEEIQLSSASGKKTTYSLATSVDVTLDSRSSTLSKLKNAFDDLESSEDMKATLTLNSKNRVTKIAAKIVDAEDEDKPLRGYLKSVKTGNNAKIVLTETTKSGAKEYTWNLDDDVTIVFDIDDTKTYDEDDYKETLAGLKSFKDDCDYEKDDCYITLTTNSKGEVTRIKAEDR